MLVNRIDIKMETQDITLIIASVGATIASIIYSLKHVKKSDCCGAGCVQEVDLEKNTIPQNITIESQI